MLYHVKPEIILSINRKRSATYREVIGVAEEAPPLVLDWDCRPVGGPTTTPPAPLAILHINNSN